MSAAFIAPDGRLRAIWRFLLSVVFVVLGPAFIAQFAAAPIQNESLYSLVVTCVTAALALIASLFLLQTLDQVREGGVRHLFRELGFRRGRAVLDTFLGLAIGFVLVTIAVVAIALIGRIRPARVPITLQTAAHGLLITVMLIVAALSEELQFRLYPFRELRESVGTLIAAIVMSVGFGAVHAANPNFGKIALFNTALIGGLLALAYIRTRTVWMIWAIHFGWNFALGVIYGLPVSGFSFAVIVRSTTVGRRWLTGGSYGIEGSITGAVVIVIGYVITWFITAPRARELARLDAITPSPQPISASVDDFDTPPGSNASNQ